MPPAPTNPAASLPAGLRLRRQSRLRARATRGDAAAFAVLFERHHQELYRFCRSILRHEEDARDAVQSAMTKAYAALQTEERDFELRPWLFRIAHNEAISILRARRPAESLDAVADAGVDSLLQTVADRERLAQLRADLLDLPERQRTALVLRELSGLSHDEIAAVLGSTSRSVKQTIFEARAALHECAEGRAMACEAVQRALSDGDGRVLRARRLRSHLSSCSECASFALALRRRPADLAVLAPPLPMAAAAALAAQVLGTAQGVALGGAGGAGGAASAGATAAGGGGLLAGAGGKVAVVAVIATVAGGTTATQLPNRSHDPPPPARRAAPAPVPSSAAPVAARRAARSGTATTVRSPTGRRVAASRRQRHAAQDGRPETAGAPPGAPNRGGSRAAEEHGPKAWQPSAANPHGAQAAKPNGNAGQPDGTNAAKRNGSNGAQRNGHTANPNGSHAPKANGNAAKRNSSNAAKRNGNAAKSNGSHAPKAGGNAAKPNGARAAQPNGKATSSNGNAAKANGNTAHAATPANSKASGVPAPKAAESPTPAGRAPAAAGPAAPAKAPEPKAASDAPNGKPAKGSP